jgi:hypothetical protein
MEKTFQEMSLRQFQQRFRTEADCRKYLFKRRWPKEFLCLVCGHSKFFDLPKRHLCQRHGHAPYQNAPADVVLGAFPAGSR